MELGLSGHRREARLRLCSSGMLRLGLGVRVICSEKELGITPFLHFLALFITRSLPIR